MMIAEDGIVVYLKPTGEGSDDSRFPEFRPYEDINRYSECHTCFVPYSDAPFQIVVRFVNEFDTFSASDVHIGLAVSTGNDETVWNYKAIDRSEIRGRQYCYHRTKDTKTPFRMSGKYLDDTERSIIAYMSMQSPSLT